MQSEREFNEGLIARTKAARRASGMTQKEIARLLGVTLDAYKNYERRTPLPLYLIERFCLGARVGADWLLWERGRPPDGAAMQSPSLFDLEP